jgi:hypothetical protein
MHSDEQRISRVEQAGLGLLPPNLPPAQGTPLRHGGMLSGYHLISGFGPS